MLAYWVMELLGWEWWRLARDEGGNVVAAGMKRIQEVGDVAVAKTLAGLWGLKKVLQMGFQKVLFESDSYNLIHALEQRPVNYAPVGLLAISSNFSMFKPSHVKSAGNTVAHFIVRLPPLNGEEQLYSHSFPQGVLSLVDLDRVS